MTRLRTQSGPEGHPEQLQDAATLAVDQHCSNQPPLLQEKGAYTAACQVLQLPPFITTFSLYTTTKPS